ncbi:c-type cytochrome [Sphingomicrobium aestuariivivum]|uniref:c-type cytochrome n=1 Tax=Sphingomicrobium aestuariivivum TaxID=1582356 RepID=UPI001FD70071|nr:c-type cytochrome [Sphingomicrobium aestuariivivum]MCJ8190363.1 cytochrome c [Sphingomicrobium aestuariivivum]
MAGALLVAGCGEAPPSRQDAVPTQAASFIGAAAGDKAMQLAHGERVSAIMGCTGCHGDRLQGNDFGAFIPLLDGLWATNISRTLPDMSDAELERLLREGVHPDREIYLMPSKQSQFLSEADMEALVAYLRTFPPTGEPSPLPPEGFEERVSAQLPDDYWAKQLEDPRFHYHNAQEEAGHFRDNQPPELGEEHALGRYVALTVCSGCHGAALDGVGEPAGSMAVAARYDEGAMRALMMDSRMLDGTTIESPWTGAPGHVTDGLTEEEKLAAGAYARAWAAWKAKQGD